MEKPDVPKKICKKCSFPKLTSEFPKKGGGKLSDWCKQCHRDYSKSHYRKNADQKIKSVKEWQKNNKEKVKTIVQKYRRKGNKIKLYPDLPPPPKDILDNILPISPKNEII